MVERGNRLLTLDGWELTKELVEGLATLEVIEEGLHGDPRANKDRRPFQDPWVAMDDSSSLRHSSQYTTNARGVPNGVRLSCGAGRTGMSTKELYQTAIRHQAGPSGTGAASFRRMLGARDHNNISKACAAARDERRRPTHWRCFDSEQANR